MLANLLSVVANVITKKCTFCNSSVCVQERGVEKRGQHCTCCADHMCHYVTGELRHRKKNETKINSKII